MEVRVVSANKLNATAFISKILSWDAACMMQPNNCNEPGLSLMNYKIKDILLYIKLDTTFWLNFLDNVKIIAWHQFNIDSTKEGLDFGGVFLSLSLAET